MHALIAVLALSAGPAAAGAVAPVPVQVPAAPVVIRLPYVGPVVLPALPEAPRWPVTPWPSTSAPAPALPGAAGQFLSPPSSGRMGPPGAARPEPRPAPPPVRAAARSLAEKADGPALSAAFDGTPAVQEPVPVPAAPPARTGRRKPSARPPLLEPARRFDNPEAALERELGVPRED